MKKIMVIFGTRPEAIKMCPLVVELRERKEANVVVCVTGQHREMLKQVLDVFAIIPEYDLDIMKERQSLFDITIHILESVKEVLQKEAPDLVLVHGDTTTAFAAALAAFYLNIPIGHVEAGLRTFQITSPFPEEFNRQAISLISRYDFAPTRQAMENLLREGKAAEHIYVTGNTGIDALKTTVCRSFLHPEIQWAKDSRLVLFTAHRRENLGAPMNHMFAAVKRILHEFPDLKVIYPVHKNPLIREAAKACFRTERRIHLLEPLDVITFHNLLARCMLVMTDSGGIQEEAASLGKPVLVMREKTERPEGILSGNLRLVGTDEAQIYESVKQLLSNTDYYREMSNRTSVYGDGYASRRIADILLAQEAERGNGLWLKESVC